MKKKKSEHDTSCCKTFPWWCRKLTKIVKLILLQQVILMFKYVKAEKILTFLPLMKKVTKGIVLNFFTRN